MQTDYERLKQEEANKSVKLQELILLNERRDQVRGDHGIFDWGYMKKRSLIVGVYLIGSKGSQRSGGNGSQRTSNVAQFAQTVCSGSSD